MYATRVSQLSVRLLLPLLAAACSSKEGDASAKAAPSAGMVIDSEVQRAAAPGATTPNSDVAPTGTAGGTVSSAPTTSAAQSAGDADRSGVVPSEAQQADPTRNAGRANVPVSTVPSPSGSGAPPVGGTPPAAAGGTAAPSGGGVSLPSGAGATPPAPGNAGASPTGGVATPPPAATGAGTGGGVVGGARKPNWAVGGAASQVGNAPGTTDTATRGTGGKIGVAAHPAPGVQDTGRRPGQQLMSGTLSPNRSLGGATTKTLPSAAGAAATKVAAPSAKTPLAVDAKKRAAVPASPRASDSVVRKPE